MEKKTLFTSESVSCGHPDKICDQISDAILDEFLKQDPESKVACECFITNNLLVIGGEAHTNATVDIIGTAKKVIEDIGYDGTNGFNPETAVFVNTLHEQSSDIRQGVDRNTDEEQGAGDQGMMFGYAIKETDLLLPLAASLANATMFAYDFLRMTGALAGCRPDAKCQYTISYDEEGGEEVDTIVISMQHDEDVTHETLSNYFIETIIPFVKIRFPELSKYLDDLSNVKLYINPTGRFVIGGPEGDTGLTGRKITVDTYGGKCPHGGGAFSGKDPSKVDRSAAYYARYIAKNIVAAGIDRECTVQLAYAIGVAEPVSVTVWTPSCTVEKEAMLSKMIKEVFNPTPYNIIKTLDLKKPIYKSTAVYGHFGWENCSWEKTDKVDEIHEWIRNYHAED